MAQARSVIGHLSWQKADWHVHVDHLCFSPKALLRDDFSKIFNSVFGQNAVVKRRLLNALAKSPLTVSELAEATGMEKSGFLTKHLEQLSVAGFVTSDKGLNPQTLFLLEVPDREEIREDGRVVGSQGGE